MRGRGNDVGIHLLIRDVVAGDAADARADLVAEGFDPQTPAVYMENVGRADARRIAAPLAGIADAAPASAGGGPAVILYGRALAAAETQA